MNGPPPPEPPEPRAGAPPPADAPVPPPPETVEPPGDEDDAGRFKTVVAVLIAITSILSAIVAWRGSESSTAAGDLDEQATQELVLQEQERAAIEGLVANDQRLFARYQEHILAWRILLEQAGENRANEALSDQLETEASAELALARSLRRFFQGGTPDFGDEDGVVVYDREFVLNNLIAGNEPLSVLDPDATFRAAEEEHDRTVRLVGVFTLIVAALFFLTIAQFARPAIRGLFAVAGAVVGATGLVTFLLVETRVL